MLTNVISRLSGEGGGEAPHFFTWFAEEHTRLAAAVLALAGILVFILFVRAVVRLAKVLVLLAILLLLLWYGGVVSTDWKQYKARFTTYIGDVVERHTTERRSIE